MGDVKLDGVWSIVTRCPVGERAFLFIVDGEWKVSRHHTIATDANGEMINTRIVKPVVAAPEPTKEEATEVAEPKRGFFACLKC